MRKIYAEALSLIQLEKKPKILDLYGSGEDLKMVSRLCFLQPYKIDSLVVFTDDE